MLRIAMWLTVIGALSASTAWAQPLRETLKDIEVAPHWIYDDLQAAIDQAKSTGKPLLVVLRCVPCPPGRTLDEQVMRPEGELADLEKKFVCVRVIQTNGLDLATFQYDYDMSWAAMFMNADGTIYGRYGTRSSSGPGSDANLSAAAFQKAAARALALHEGYPANKAQLAAKKGPTPEYARPEETPGLTDKPHKATSRQNCIHCHMVKEYALRAKWEAGRLKAEDLFVYPQPSQIGLELNNDDGLVVKSVRSGSAAAQAGIRAGDELVSLGGQPLVSTADVQWVLHHAPSEVKLPATIRRGEKPIESSLSLSGDWKRSDIAWRASSWYGLRQGVKFDPLPETERKSRGIEEGRLALVVKGLFGKGGPKVQKAGLKQGDVIVAVDGDDQRLSESDFLADLRLNKGPKDSVKLTVLRGKERRELEVPLW
jgi:serine protease Do